MRHITTHIIHCSDSTFGDASEIDRWHKARGWRGIGYHFVILPSGEIEVGRPMNQVGAHVRGHNKHSVGTCLIGKTDFTPAQMTTLQVLHLTLKAMVPKLEAYGHRDFDRHKTCPNFEARDILR